LKKTRLLAITRAMVLLDSGTLRGLWQQTPKLSTRSPSRRMLPRAMPARVTMMGMGLKHPHSPNDPFLTKLAAAASTELGKAQLAGASGVSDGPPLLDILTNPTMMAAPAQVGRVLNLFGFYESVLSEWLCF